MGEDTQPQGVKESAWEKFFYFISPSAKRFGQVLAAISLVAILALGFSIYTFSLLQRQQTVVLSHAGAISGLLTGDLPQVQTQDGKKVSAWQVVSETLGRLASSSK